MQPCFSSLFTQGKALVVLFLAWSLGSVMGELDAAGYLVENLRTVLDPRLLPTLVFLISAATAFATGTSFGTMGTHRLHIKDSDSDRWG